jgi:two-component system, NarL family, invasion response regulator UvrY
MAAIIHSTFPLEPTQTSSSEITSSEKGLWRVRTVVVDDSETFLRIVSCVLDLEDTIDLVGAASHGLEAIDMVTRLKPGLILIDVNMPGMDGLATARFLASMSPTPAVVLMSTDNTPELRAACRRAGAFDFVHKENFRAEFEKVVQRLLRTRLAC